MATAADFIIIGLGATGSAAAHQLARRGASVIGFDRYHPPHALGSSHGETRIIREAYFEHPAYVPLVQRAYDLWRDLEREAAAPLLAITGGLMIGAPESVLVKGALQSARQHGLSHEVLNADALRLRFPQFRAAADMVAVYEPHAGVLRPEACVTAQLKRAAALGADLRYDEPVAACGADATGVWVETAQGRYRAKRLVVCAGAWVAALLPNMVQHVAVERQVLHWFTNQKPHLFSPNRCPIHLWQMADGQFFYGFPDFGDGLKIAIHHSGATVLPETVAREVLPSEVAEVATWRDTYMPLVGTTLLRSEVCLYTNTRDEHFWLDWQDESQRILVASACSGHGFKFSPVLGEVIANALMGSPQAFDLSLFRAR